MCALLSITSEGIQPTFNHVPRARSHSVRIGGCGKPTKPDIGVSNGVGSGTEGVEGVLEKECDVEGGDTARREVLSSEILMKPRAWALEAGLEDARVMANTENNVELAG